MLRLTLYWHIPLPIVTKHELGLPIPPKNLHIKFGVNPSTIFLVIVVTDRQTHTHNPTRVKSYPLAFAGITKWNFNTSYDAIQLKYEECNYQSSYVGLHYIDLIFRRTVGSCNVVRNIWKHLCQLYQVIFAFTSTWCFLYMFRGLDISHFCTRHIHCKHNMTT